MNTALPPFAGRLLIAMRCVRAALVQITYCSGGVGVLGPAAGSARAAPPGRWPARRSDRTCPGCGHWSGSGAISLGATRITTAAAASNARSSRAETCGRSLTANSTTSSWTDCRRAQRSNWRCPASVASTVSGCSQLPAGLVNCHRAVGVLVDVDPNRDHHGRRLLSDRRGRLGRPADTPQWGRSHAPISARRSALTSGDRHNP